MKTAKKVTTLKTSVTHGSIVVKRLLKFRKGAKVFSQGARADAIFVVKTGKVEVTVISAYGKEAVLRVLGPHDFLGEECLVGGSLRTTTATSLGPSTVFRIEKRSMLRAFHIQPELSQKFLASLLARSADLEQDLLDQRFDHCEKRLARLLVKLARIRQDYKGSKKAPRVTHTILAEMVGTSRSRITFLMNKFKKAGLIDYECNGDLTVMAELLTDIVLAAG